MKYNIIKKNLFVLVTLVFSGASHASSTWEFGIGKYFSEDKYSNSYFNFKENNSPVNYFSVSRNVTSDLLFNFVYRNYEQTSFQFVSGSVVLIDTISGLETVRIDNIQENRKLSYSLANFGLKYGRYYGILQPNILVSLGSFDRTETINYTYFSTPSNNKTIEGQSSYTMLLLGMGLKINLFDNFNIEFSSNYNKVFDSIYGARFVDYGISFNYVL